MTHGAKVQKTENKTKGKSLSLISSVFYVYDSASSVNNTKKIKSNSETKVVPPPGLGQNSSPMNCVLSSFVGNPCDRCEKNFADSQKLRMHKPYAQLHNCQKN